MPELPEVEAARRAIEEHCVGKKIKRAVIAEDGKVIEGVSRMEFESSITGKTIVAALRKGKNMWLRLDSPPFPSFQFGMSGAVYIKGVAVTKYKRCSSCCFFPLVGGINRLTWFFGGWEGLQ